MRKISAIAIVALLMLATVQMASADEIPASSQVLECTMGISVDGTPLGFGAMFPGVSSGIIGRVMTVTGNVGGSCSQTIPVDITATKWIGNGVTLPTMPSTATTVAVEAGTPTGIPETPIELELGGFEISTPTLNFQVTIPDNQVADSYTQTITVTGVY